MLLLLLDLVGDRRLRQPAPIHHHAAGGGAEHAFHQGAAGEVLCSAAAWIHVVAPDRA